MFTYWQQIKERRLKVKDYHFYSYPFYFQNRQKLNFRNHLWMKNFPGPLRQNGSIGNILSFVLLTEVLLSVQLLSRVWLFETPWTAALQACLSSTISRSVFTLMSIEMLIPSSHLVSFSLLSVFSCVRAFSNELAQTWFTYMLLAFFVSCSP